MFFLDKNEISEFVILAKIDTKIRDSKSSIKKHPQKLSSKYIHNATIIFQKTTSTIFNRNTKRLQFKTSESTKKIIYNYFTSKKQSKSINCKIFALSNGNKFSTYHAKNTVY